MMQFRNLNLALGAALLTLVRALAAEPASSPVPTALNGSTDNAVNEDTKRPIANAFYPNNREPLLKTQFVRLPLGAIKPRGWLRDQLTVQANGLTGHLNEVWDWVASSAWKGDQDTNIAKGPFAAKMVPRWLEGLVPLAYMLDDQHLKDVVDQYLKVPLTVNDLTRVTPNVGAWASLGWALPDYYEATHDARALQLCRKILDYADAVRVMPNYGLKEDFNDRIGVLLTFSWWYYKVTGDKDIPDLMERVTRSCVDEHRRFFLDFTNEDKTADRAYPVEAGDFGAQGYDLTEGIQFPVLYYLESKDESYKKSVYRVMAALDKFDGQVGGRWNADEWLAGRDPTHGTELCDATELSSGLENMFEALGDPAFMDRLEQLIFNAVPGTCTPDYWAHQYVQQANQVLVSVDKRPWRQDRDDSNIYGFYPNYWCCLSNMHSTFPRYIKNMWMATADNGLVAAAYGPCELNAQVADGMNVDIVEDTTYPFSDAVRFVVRGTKPAVFPLYFRIPLWAERAELTVSGEKPRLPRSGAIFEVMRNWKPGDTVDLDFHYQVRTEPRMNNAVSIAWGPLSFVERIGESFQEIPTKFPLKQLGAVNWEIRPSTDWNYGLAIDRNHPEYTMTRNKLGAVPFAQKGEPIWDSGSNKYVTWKQDVPIILTMKARQIPRWGMNGANAGPVPFSPMKVATGETTIELIPYGCSRLRISEFPTVESPPVGGPN